MKALPLLALCLLSLSACARKTMISQQPGGYEIVTIGADSTMHVAGNQELWHTSPAGQRVKVWGYLGSAPRLIGKIALFNGGLSDKRGEKALLAYTPGGHVVEITERVVGKFCVQSNMNYQALSNQYSIYFDKPGEKETIEVTAMGKHGGMTLGAFDVKLTEAEVKQWMDLAVANGKSKKYDGIQYFIAEPELKK
jgi:hypothetical protein